jgi:Flp pilus assembly protein TadD
MKARALILAALALTGCARTPAPAPTFTKDIAPILTANCVSCHQPGHAAPFSLITFDDVRPRAARIVAAVGSRYMPPWLPDHAEPPFIGERRLTDDQIAIIKLWAGDGAPEGDRSARPVMPPPSTSWTLGEPDLVAQPPKAYTLAADGHDVYRNLVIRLDAPQQRYVRALEFLPGDAPVHHAVIRVDRNRVSRAEDGRDGQPGFDGMAAGDVQDPDGHFLGWAPGRGPILAPDALPWILSPGADLVVELHLMPSTKPIEVQPAIGLYFTDRAPQRSPVMMIMGSKAIDIPAGTADYWIEDRYALPVDVEVLSVYPHAHYLGREMEVRAVAPDGASRTLLRIRKWSFNWQQDYRYVTPIALPRGTTIVMRYSYDNSASNVNNPAKPPRRVTWGPQSHDEMGTLGVQVVTRSTDDAARLASSFAQHAALIDVAGAETLVKADPHSPAYAAMLGASYVHAGRIAEAIPALERAIGLDPRSASSENFLGGALLASGRGPDALQHFRAAAALAPRDAHIRFNYAKTLAAAGQGSRAIAELTRSLELDPMFGEAHQEIGVLLFSANRLTDAIHHLQRAADLMPHSADVRGDLGGALAEAGRRDEAIAVLRRGLELDPQNQTARQNLALLERTKTR